MVIQRIQSLMLLIAAVLTAVFCFVPFASVETGSAVSAVMVKDAPVLLILNIVVGLLMFLIIFMYRDLRRQMRMTLLAMVLLCASIVTCGFIVFVGIPGAELVLLGGVSLLVLALLFALLAYRGMKRAHRLLTSADRLR